MIRFKSIAAGFCLGIAVVAVTAISARAAVILSDNFVGYTGTNTPPSGWGQFSTAGIGVESSQSLFWQSLSPNTPNSPDGDVFYVRSQSFPTLGEGMGIAVSGLIAGQNYTISFFNAASSAFNAGDAFWEVFVDGGSVGNSLTAIAGSELVWITSTLNFSATSSTHTIGVQGRSVGLQGNALLDGFSVSDAASTIPEPVSLAILAFSLAGLGFVRRRRLA